MECTGKMSWCHAERRAASLTPGRIVCDIDHENHVRRRWAHQITRAIPGDQTHTLSLDGIGPDGVTAGRASPRGGSP